MPSSINGIGTTYYGRSELGPDGSYITTEWFIVVFIPIFPIASYRVLQTGGGKYYVVYNSTEYLIQRVPLNWRQVRKVYGIVGGIVVTFALLAVFMIVASA